MKTHAHPCSLLPFSPGQKLTARIIIENPYHFRSCSLGICEHLDGIKLMLTFVLAMKGGMAQQSCVMKMYLREAIGSLRTECWGNYPCSQGVPYQCYNEKGSMCWEYPELAPVKSAFTPSSLN